MANSNIDERGNYIINNITSQIIIYSISLLRFDQALQSARLAFSFALGLAPFHCQIFLCLLHLTVRC